MKTCAVCGKKMATGTCRRCGRPICARCHFHHGLCRPCAKALGRMRS